jgi:hypothetical protein
MNAHCQAPSHTLRRLVFAASTTALAAFPAIGCDSVNQPDRNLRAGAAAIRSLHGDADAIGALDATAPPADLNDYRKPVYRTVPAR